MKPVGFQHLHSNPFTQSVAVARPFIAAAETGNLEEVKWLWSLDDQSEKAVKKEMDTCGAMRETLGARLPLLKSLQATFLADLDVKPVTAAIEDWAHVYSVFN